MPRHADPHTKIELLRAAEAVFAERGLSAAKVEHITARAGVSKGAFYLHFESKDDCWREIIEGFVAKLANCVDVRPPALLQGPVEVVALREHWHAHDLEIFEFCWQNRALFKMVLGGGGGVPYAYLIDEFADRVAKNVEGWIRDGVEAGLYRGDLDPAVVGVLLAGAYDRLVRELIAQPKRPDIAAWSKQALELFTRGLLTEEAAQVVDHAVSVSGEGPVSARRAGTGGAGLSRGRRAKGEAV
jgi:AcrR family transcriptional regulator